ncbi:uncharacterized protein LOC134681139 [Mytilus trossulus]|uniref:uncharacterized protein LOC134681139 n=1 Tax=Mytilus trossulus TaxID=6551 RepID=UPI0030063631
MYRKYVSVILLQLLCVILSIQSIYTKKEEIERLQKEIGKLSRQVMLQQLFIEEKIRSDGDSGLKQTRIINDGTKPYHFPTTRSKRGVAAIHDHSHMKRTIGVGEFVAVLNGVEFRTRHNDPELRMPSTTSNNFLETEEIPFPDVPPEVIQKPTEAEQVQEMREWFRAFNNQNYTERDYRKYFKPVLCYLEGMWVYDNYSHILEPFLSDRHQFDASTFNDLEEKIMFTSYGGRKDGLENFGWLPKTIINIENGKSPLYGQWIYRIVCHPLKRDLPLNRLRMADDLSSRMMFLRSEEEEIKTRRARFKLNQRDSNVWNERFNQNPALIDSLMSEIPGLDNYGGNLTDEALNLPAYSADGKNMKKKKLLNSAYYHRFWEEIRPDYMRLSLRKRAFSDSNLFMSMTSQPQVGGKSLNYCTKEESLQNKPCKYYNQRWSYAVPFEIIYLNPLSNWNPYNITYKGHYKNDPEAQYVTEKGKRNGGNDIHTAYNGTNSWYFFQTPQSFYSGKERKRGNAGNGGVGVLDRTGKVRYTRSAGIRVFLPEIKDIGIIRQRYPIMPLYSEGNAAYKEMESLKDIVLENNKYLKMFHNVLEDESIEKLRKKQIKLSMKSGITLIMSMATISNPGPHTHYIDLSAENVKALKSNKKLNVRSSEDSGHFHRVKIIYRPHLSNPFVMKRCDNKRKCWDGHKKLLLENEAQMPEVEEAGKDVNEDERPESYNE